MLKRERHRRTRSQRIGQGACTLLRQIDLTGLKQHFRQVASHVHRAGVFDVTHRHLQEPGQRGLQVAGQADPLHVLAEGLFSVDFDDPALAGKIQVFRLPTDIPDQFQGRPNGLGREESQRPGCRQVPDEGTDGLERL